MLHFQKRIIRENVTLLVVDINVRIIIIAIVTWGDKSMLGSNLNNQVMLHKMDDFLVEYIYGALFLF